MSGRRTRGSNRDAPSPPTPHRQVARQLRCASTKGCRLRWPYSRGAWPRPRMAMPPCSAPRRGEDYRENAFRKTGTARKKPHVRPPNFGAYGCLPHRTFGVFSPSFRKNLGHLTGGSSMLKLTVRRQPMSEHSYFAENSFEATLKVEHVDDHRWINLSSRLILTAIR
jgi:hypothetical protein